MWRQWIGLLVLSAHTPAFAATWSFEGGFGTAHTVGTRIRIEQEGQEPVAVNGRYSTRPLASPQYLRYPCRPLGRRSHYSGVGRDRSENLLVCGGRDDR